MIYYCKGVSLMKLKTMCKLYVSLLLPCPRVNSLYLLPLSDFPPDIVPVLFNFYFQGCSFPTALLVLVCILFEVHSFNKHVEKGFWQHGLGTSYSNSACFDKDDIWRKKMQFLVQCMLTTILSPFTLNWIFVKIRQWSHTDQKGKIPNEHSTL